MDVSILRENEQLKLFENSKLHNFYFKNCNVIFVIVNESLVMTPQLIIALTDPINFKWIISVIITVINNFMQNNKI